MAEFPCPNCGGEVGAPGAYLSYNGAPRKAVCDCPVCQTPLAFPQGGDGWRRDEEVRHHRYPSVAVLAATSAKPEFQSF
jgi:hypothetical protein